MTTKLIHKKSRVFIMPTFSSLALPYTVAPATPRLASQKLLVFTVIFPRNHKDVFVFAQLKVNLTLHVAVPYMSRPELTQRTQDVITTSLLHQSDVATSFWRNNGVIITSYVRWVVTTAPADIANAARPAFKPLKTGSLSLCQLCCH